MQDHLEWSHQAQQVAHPRVVQINLLHLDAAHEQPGMTPMDMPEFQFTGRYKPVQHLGCIGWTVYLYPCYIFLYTIFWGYTVWIHSTYTIICLPSTTQFWHWGEFFQCSLYGGSLDDVGVDQRLFGPSTAAPLWKIPTQHPHRDLGSAWQPHPENQLIDITQKQ